MKKIMPSITSAAPAKLLSLLGWLAALFILMPLLALVFESLSSFFSAREDETFAELADNVLSVYALNSLLTVLGSVIFSLLFATLPAWWCAHYQFKGRNWLVWLMVFPLAIPAYISAYIYTDTLDYAGPIQTTLRSWFDWQSPQDYWFFDIRSIWGASLMLALALYPYLFLLLYNAFERSPANLRQAARLMGAGQQRIFWTISLPLVRPAMAVGCTLIAMESLADYGTVQLFAVNTLTTAVYDSWLVYGSLATAAKISILTLLFVLALVGMEKYSRRKQQHFDSRNQQTQQNKVQPSSKKLLTIWGYCGLIFALGFAIPVYTLISYSADYWAENWQGPLWQHSLSTFELAGISALVATLIALLLNSQNRFQPTIRNQNKLTISSLGYAIPGTVLAIGLLIPFGEFDLWFNRLLVHLGFDKVGLLLSGTSFALIAAFIIRFAAISNGSIQSAYQQLPANLDNASTMLNGSRLRTFMSIHLPILTPAVVSAFLLVFIECVKELPASLLLRPFDFETLATFVYQFASDEQLEHAALAALMIVMVSLLPIFLLSRTQAAMQAATNSDTRG
jgi:iron(III) transport system permease protein